MKNEGGRQGAVESAADVTRDHASRRFILSLFLVGWTTTLLVLPAGAPLVSDSPARLGVAHSLLTGDPPLQGLQSEAHFVLYDRHGHQTPWYGIGQSLVMLPVDAVASLSGARTARARFLVVEYALFPVINGLAVVAAGALLLALGYGYAASAGGALGLVFCSTALWHFQNNQENPLQMLLVATALLSALRWIQTRGNRWLVGMGAALGLDLLIRLPNAVDALLISAFPLLLLRSGRDVYWRGWLRYVAPGIGLAMLVDRLYHFARFGVWTGTYVHFFGAAARAAEPSLPGAFPFSTAFGIGFAGPFISLQKSVFIFDPLVLVAILALIVRWRHLSHQIRVVALLSCAGVIAYAAGYATYYNWGGASSWGDRFLTTWVWVLCLLALPLLRTWPLRRPWLVAAVGVALPIQIASIVLPSWIEEVQLNEQQVIVEDRLSVPEAAFDRFVLGKRFQNLAAGALGTFSEWELGRTPNGDIGPHPPKIAVVMELQSLPKWAAISFRVGWCTGLTVLIALILQLMTWSKQQDEAEIVRGLRHA